MPTMPRDGSGRLTPPERILYAAAAVACTAVLVWIALLLSGSVLVHGSGQQEGPAVTDARERITDGAYVSWLASDGCARGQQECRDALREANARMRPYGLRVFEDGSVAPR